MEGAGVIEEVGHHVGDAGDARMVPERFAAVDVGDVDLDGGQGHGGDRVAQGHRHVGQASRVDDDAGASGRVSMRTRSWLLYTACTPRPCSAAAFATMSSISGRMVVP